MFSTLRNRFGIPGVISVIALIFAMFGGAYAASNSSGGGKATASAKAKQGPRGKTGKTGPAGPAGPTGPAGPAGPAGPGGAKGDAGAPGTNGTNGTNGANGTSVLASNEATGTANCEGRGGSKFVTGATTTFACNGKDGIGGGGGGGLPATLGTGETETGTFAYNAEQEGAFLPISFNVPLSAALDASHVIFAPAFGTNPDPTHCPGNASTPEASSGYLCLYGFAANATFNGSVSPDFAAGAEGTGTAGAILKFAREPLGEPPNLSIFVTGAWAVTG
jgi:hypothetical protein